MFLGLIICVIKYKDNDSCLFDCAAILVFGVYIFALGIGHY